jgi:hypothetical protein
MRVTNFSGMSSRWVAPLVSGSVRAELSMPAQRAPRSSCKPFQGSCQSSSGGFNKRFKSARPTIRASGRYFLVGRRIWRAQSGCSWGAPSKISMSGAGGSPVRCKTAFKHRKPWSSSSAWKPKKHWRRLQGFELIPKIIMGVRFVDGEEQTQQAA